MRAEFAERSKAMAQADRGVVYWRAEANASRTYYFSPDAAEIVEDLLSECGQSLCIAPDVQRMLREGFQEVRW